MGAAAHRFQVGDEVFCRTGKTAWEAGKVIKIHYEKPGYEKPGLKEVQPYQVQLYTGDLMYVPSDDDKSCQKLQREWWEGLVKRGDLSGEDGVDELQKLSNGQDLDAKDWKGDTALICALQEKWLPGVQALLELHADPNLGGEMQERPLQYAVFLGEPLVKQFLQAKADPNLQDQDPDKDPDWTSRSFKERPSHRTPLHYAAEVSAGVTRALLEGRADPNIRDAQYMQPLHLAIEEKNAEVVDLLLQAGADVNTGNMEIGMSSTALMAAVYQGDCGVVAKLIRAKVDIDRRGKQGMTALHLAARRRRPDCAKLLLEALADVSILAMGKTARELAVSNGMDDMAELLRGEAAPTLTKRVRRMW